MSQQFVSRQGMVRVLTLLQKEPAMRGKLEGRTVRSASRLKDSDDLDVPEIVAKTALALLREGSDPRRCAKPLILSVAYSIVAGDRQIEVEDKIPTWGAETYRHRQKTK